MYSIPGKQRNSLPVFDRAQSGTLLLKGAGGLRSRQPKLHKEMEVILMRQLADCLGMPIFLVDAHGTLLFYNEPAEALLGVRFEETGELTASEWGTAFVPTDERGHRLPVNKLPLMIALHSRRPAQADFWIRGLDQVARRISVMAFPLIGRSNRFLGGVAVFWELDTE